MRETWASARFQTTRAVTGESSQDSWPSRAHCEGRDHSHVFRHTAAVHLLEADVEANVIRGWLGFVSLETANRHAEIAVHERGGHETV